MSELIDIRVEDVKINGKAIITIRSGKGNKERTVYMSLDLYEKRDIRLAKKIWGFFLLSGINILISMVSLTFSLYQEMILIFQRKNLSLYGKTIFKSIIIPMKLFMRIMQRSCG